MAPHFNFDVLKNRFNMMNKVVLDNIKVIKNHPDFKESMYLDPFLKTLTGEIAYFSFFSNSKMNPSDIIE